MEFRSQFDTQEFLRASKAVERVTSKRHLVWLLALGAPVFIAGISLIGGYFDAVDPVWMRVPLWPWLFFPLLSFVGIPLLVRWQLLRAVKANPRLPCEMVRIVTADGLECRDDGTAARFEWRAIERVVATDEFYLFFYTKKCAYFLPRRLVGAQERTQLHTLLRDRIDPHLLLLDSTNYDSA